MLIKDTQKDQTLVQTNGHDLLNELFLNVENQKIAIKRENAEPGYI